MTRILFRFFFIYFLLTTAPWQWLYAIPGISFLVDLYDQGDQAIVELVNKYFLHVKDTLNRNGGGSGDTSFAWAQFHTHIILSVIASAIWSFVDRKKQTDYETLGYWLRTLLRYYLSLFAFTYGIIKLFCLQMPFPNLSQLATPLGDYLPMRFSWMFIGYSVPYQFFSGVAETIVGILLLSRRTTTLGALLGIGVFTNVFLLNLSYDIPVKLFSMQLLICCLYLAACDWKRLYQVFVRNTTAEPSSLYDINLTKKWQKIGRWVWKAGFIVLFVAMPFNRSWSRYKSMSENIAEGPIRTGIYNIKLFVKNKDTVAVATSDEIMWKDFIFDKGGMGSIHTQDTLFTQRYRRGYFAYRVDSVNQTVAFKSSLSAMGSLFEMKYNIPDKQTVQLSGIVRADSLYFLLERSDRQFQLAERQFHWISEANR